MESTKKPNIISTIDLPKYTELELAIKEKIRLGILLTPDDYELMAEDAIKKYPQLDLTDENISKYYLPYLTLKYASELRFDIVKKYLNNYKSKC